MIVFDPLSQYAPEPGEVVFHDPGELKKYLAPFGRTAAGRNKPFRVLYQVRSGTVINNWRKVGVTAYATGNLLLLIDEMGMLVDDGKYKSDAKGKDPILESIVPLGRHRNINVICTAQRPVQVARSYSALCTEMRVFQTSENSDLTYLSDRMGQSAAKRTSTLPKFVFMHWTDDGVEIYRPKLKG